MGFQLYVLQIKSSSRIPKWPGQGHARPNRPKAAAANSGASARNLNVISKGPSVALPVLTGPSVAKVGNIY